MKEKQDIQIKTAAQAETINSTTQTTTTTTTTTPLTSTTTTTTIPTTMTEKTPTQMTTTTTTPKTTTTPPTTTSTITTAQMTVKTTTLPTTIPTIKTMPTPTTTTTPTITTTVITTPTKSPKKPATTTVPTSLSTTKSLTKAGALTEQISAKQIMYSFVMKYFQQGPIKASKAFANSASHAKAVSKHVSSEETNNGSANETPTSSTTATESFETATLHVHVYPPDTPASDSIESTETSDKTTTNIRTDGSLSTEDFVSISSFATKSSQGQSGSGITDTTGNMQIAVTGAVPESTVINNYSESTTSVPYTGRHSNAPTIFSDDTSENTALNVIGDTFKKGKQAKLIFARNVTVKYRKDAHNILFFRAIFRLIK